MRKAARVCLRMYEIPGLALPAIVVVCGLTLVFDFLFFFVIGSGVTVRPHEWTLNYWLLLVLGASYSVWTALRARGVVDAAAGQWFVLAACSLWMRTYCFLLLFGLSETYGDRSVVEDAATSSGRFLIGFHRYGGLLGFALGLAMVAWCSRRISPRRGREGSWPSGRGPAAARGARARPTDSRPS